jgi:FMN phosphatase YigB (HAD superfamily)
VNNLENAGTSPKVEDVTGAKAVGMITIWLGSGECPEADFRIGGIVSVPSILESRL